MKVKRGEYFAGMFFLVTFLLFVQGCNTINFPKGDYPNGELLVSADVLETILEAPGVVIIDARASGYDVSHIPGAISMKWNDYVDADSTLNSLSTLEAQLGALGLNRNMTIIIYDDTLTSWGSAGRIFWMLEYLGCTDVHILNGGWDVWVAEGRQTESSVNTLPANTFIAAVKSSYLMEKDRILKNLDNENFVVIDPREDEEYNGWTLYGETRGGHIPGAININYQWFYNNDNNTIRDYNSLKEMFESYNITTDKTVTSYCTAGIRSGLVYFTLRLMGYKDISNYDGSMYEWSADASCPMDSLENYEKLVYPAWVKQLIEGGNPGTAGSPPTYTGNKYVIVHASSLYWKGAADPNGYNRNEDYESGHIPGAIHIPLHMFDVTEPDGIYPWTRPEDGMLLEPEALKAAIEKFGITHDTMVIVYNGDKSYIGGAYRVAWALMYAGVEDVRYLNGDLALWSQIGGEIETTTNIPEPVEDFGVTVPVHPEYYASIEDIEEMIDDPDSVIGDDRSWIEYSANDESACIYDFFCVPGYIPNAKWVQNMNWYLDDISSGNNAPYGVPVTLRAYTEVQAEWAKAGISKNTRVSFYCGGGWRSSLVWYYAYLMGYENPSNFASGWYEWTWDTERPIEYYEN